MFYERLYICLVTPRAHARSGVKQWVLSVSVSVSHSLPGQTLRARLTGDEREREGGSADSEQDSVIQWNVYNTQ